MTSERKLREPARVAVNVEMPWRACRPGPSDFVDHGVRNERAVAGPDGVGHGSEAELK